MITPTPKRRRAVPLGKGAFLVLTLLVAAAPVAAAPRHSPTSRFPSYSGRVMCGYQGWFRAEGDGSGSGWVHYGAAGKFDPTNLTVDLWPDVREYPQTYPTVFRKADGSTARVFSSWDASTVDVHFRWMKDYGIDGVFVQRFFGNTRSPRSRERSRVILEHALHASQEHGRAFAVMYDLSGLRAEGEDCSSVMQDWRELVDTVGITTQGTNQTYLYHRGRPLVAIWGLGFPDRPYDIRHIGIEQLLDFLKDDPEYGGCSVMLGVPTYFRELNRDTRPDPFLHEVMARADVVLPWMVSRFNSKVPEDVERYGARVAADVAWCRERQLDYAACVYPGFSWYNLSRHEFAGRGEINANPRQKGRFFWNLIATAVSSGAPMLYVAMFDEIDEGTAIFKCTNEPPEPVPPAQFLTYENLPTDHYLWLTGQAGKLLRREISASPDRYLRANPATRDLPGSP